MSRVIEGTTAAGYRCDAAGCDLVASHSPVVCVPYKGYPIEVRGPVIMFTDVHACPRHWWSLRSGEFISKKMKATIAETAYAAHGEADFARAYVKPIPCHSYEYLQFQQRAGLVAPDDAMAKGSIAPV